MGCQPGASQDRLPGTPGKPLWSGHQHPWNSLSTTIWNQSWTIRGVTHVDCPGCLLWRGAEAATLCHTFLHSESFLNGEIPDAGGVAGWWANRGRAALGQGLLFSLMAESKALLPPGLTGVLAHSRPTTPLPSPSQNCPPPPTTCPIQQWHPPRIDWLLLT